MSGCRSEIKGSFLGKLPSLSRSLLPSVWRKLRVSWQTAGKLNAPQRGWCRNRTLPRLHPLEFGILPGWAQLRCPSQSQAWGQTSLWALDPTARPM
jgi:hypothetical protein